MIIPSREHLIHSLYEAAELEHNLMCTYLYAAFSLREGSAEGLTGGEITTVAAWRRTILDVAIEEMGHLAAVWNITAALGAAPRFGRTNFPLDPGFLPANIVVKLAPFTDATLQHFIYLERPIGSSEPEGEGFTHARQFVRANETARLTPMGIDYESVGEFYGALKENLSAFVERFGEAQAFRGDPALQLAGGDYGFQDAKPVTCLETVLGAFDSIVSEGEGSPSHADNSHFQRFVRIRDELGELRAAHREFQPAFPAATNPVLRAPPDPAGRVWLENPQAVVVVDLANAAYGLMLRLMAYAYAVPRPLPAKSAAIRLGIGLMRAVAALGQHAARLTAGPSHAGCHAGMSFTTLRDSAALPVSASAEAFFRERLAELADVASGLEASADTRLHAAVRQINALATQAEHEFPAR